MLVLILGFTYLPPEKGSVITGIVLIVCGIALIVTFIIWENNHPFAILPAGILKNKKIIYSLIGAALNFAMITTVTF